MKKTFLLLLTFVLTFTLISCNTSDTVFTLYIVSDDEVALLEDLDGFNDILLAELESLNTDYTKVDIVVGDKATGLNFLATSKAHAIVLDPATLMGGEAVTRILSSVQMEYDFETMLHVEDVTYSTSIVLSDTPEAIQFAEYLDTVDGDFAIAELMNLDVCATATEEDMIKDYLLNQGVTTELYSRVLFNSFTESLETKTQEEKIYGLYDGSCDLTVVVKEYIADYQEVFEDNLDLSKVTILQDVEDHYYSGIYVSSDAEGDLNNIIAQAFINIASHNSNDMYLEALGQKGYQLYK